MNRADLIEEVAPPSPPCFAGRRNWVLYLQSAADAKKPGRGANGPLIIDTNGLPVFNRAFSFCNDCDPRHKEAMCAVSRCRPSFLREDNVLVVKKIQPAGAKAPEVTPVPPTASAPVVSTVTAVRPKPLRVVFPIGALPA